MLPTEQFSGDATKGPPWTPQVWRDGPDVLVAQARQMLFDDQDDLVSEVLNGHNRAMAGGQTAPQNESDITYDTKVAGEHERSSADGQDGRIEEWKKSMDDLRATEPRIAGWSSGDHTGPANPAP